jgi:hypothetical protein
MQYSECNFDYSKSNFNYSESINPDTFPNSESRIGLGTKSVELPSHYEGIKLRTTLFAVTEKAYADAFPVTTFHGEGFGRGIVDAVGAIGELVAILLAVVGDAKPKLREFSLFDNLSFAVSLNENALFTEPNAAKSLARTE